MSGCCSGVQQRIRAVAPMAVYIHCYAHCLNLVLVDSTESVPEAAEFFALLEILYVFTSSSKVHILYIQQQTSLHPHKPVRQLQHLSDTRWACRYAAVDAMCSTLDSILATLQSIIDGDDRHKAVEASVIYLQINSFKFLTTLIIVWRVLSYTKQLSDHLQNARIDMGKAADLVIATLDMLQQFRSDEEWDKVYKYIHEVAALNNITVTPLRSQRQW